MKRRIQPRFPDLLALLLLACWVLFPLGARADSPPDWIHDHEREFPHAFYIADVGAGDTDQSARNSAKAHIAMVFQSEVQAVEKIVKLYWEDEEDVERSTELREQIEVSTQQSLRNVVIAKTWYDPESGRHHALAALDRRETARLYRQDLARLDAEAREHFRRAQAPAERLVRLAFLNRAVALAAARDLLGRQLQVVEPDGTGFQPTVGLAELRASRLEISREIGVRIELDEGTSSKVDATVRAVLQSYGFRLVEENPRYQLRGSFTTTKLARQGHFVGWELSLHLAEVEGGAELATYSRSGREGHTSIPEAQRRAERKACEELRRGFRQELEAYLDALMGGH